MTDKTAEIAKTIEHQIRMIDIGCGDEFRIPDAIADARKEKTLAHANDLIGCVAAWAADDIVKKHIRAHAQQAPDWQAAVDLTEKGILAEYYSGRLNGDSRIREGFKNLRAALAAQPPAAPVVEVGPFPGEDDAGNVGIAPRTPAGIEGLSDKLLGGLTATVESLQAELATEKEESASYHRFWIEEREKRQRAEAQIALLKSDVKKWNDAYDLTVSQVENAAASDQLIGAIEERFPNWKSYRDLIDCIDCTLHELRKEGGQ